MEKKKAFNINPSPAHWPSSQLIGWLEHKDAYLTILEQDSAFLSQKIAEYKAAAINSLLEENHN